MKTATARRHVRSTVLANSENGYRGDLQYNRPVVLLDVDQLWTYEYRQHAPEGERTVIGRARATTRPNKGDWRTGVTGWLALAPWGDRDHQVTPEELLAVAAGLDATTFPANAAKVELPKGYRLVTLMPATVHDLPWDELRAKRAEDAEAGRRRDEVLRAKREEAEARARATMSHLREVTDILGVDEPSFFPPADAPLVPILRLLERLARAEGVELPARPEHLRDR